MIGNLWTCTLKMNSKHIQPTFLTLILLIGFYYYAFFSWTISILILTFVSSIYYAQTKIPFYLFLAFIMSFSFVMIFTTNLSYTDEIYSLELAGIDLWFQAFTHDMGTIDDGLLIGASKIDVILTHYDGRESHLYLQELDFYTQKLPIFSLFNEDPEYYLPHIKGICLGFSDSKTVILEKNTIVILEVNCEKRQIVY